MVGEAVDIAVTLRAADAARRGLVVRHGEPSSPQRSAGSLLVCPLDMDREANRVFLMQLKQEHPQVIVITLSEGSDSQRLIELINRARIFRVLGRSSGFQTLVRALYAAFDLVRRHRLDPRLLRRQRPEPPADT